MSKLKKIANANLFQAKHKQYESSLCYNCQQRPPLDLHIPEVRGGHTIAKLIPTPTGFTPVKISGRVSLRHITTWCSTRAFFFSLLPLHTQRPIPFDTITVRAFARHDQRNFHPEHCVPVCTSLLNAEHMQVNECRLVGIALQTVSRKNRDVKDYLRLEKSFSLVGLTFSLLRTVH